MKVRMSQKDTETGNKPPRHTIREAMDFIEWSARQTEPEQLRRQKEWEEQIDRRFYFPDERGMREPRMDVNEHE